jgi:hypothetical protein
MSSITSLSACRSPQALRSLVAAALACLCASAVARADETAVTPYRPTVSNPAQLSSVGQLELEAGVLASRSGDGARRASLPYLLKLALSEQWGVLVGGEALVQSHEADGPRVRGVGDTSIVLKRAFIVDEATAFGLELGAKLPTAKDSIGSGKADYTINGIVSRDVGAVHLDANANVTRVGAIDAGTGRTQDGLALALSTPIASQWGVAGELAGTRQHGAASTAQLLLAATYSPSKHLTFDVGVIRGLNPATPDWSLFSGVVLPLGQLW